MRPLHIPRSFMLGGLRINVIRDDTLIEKRGMAAESRYNEQEISLDLLHAKPEFTEQAFWHELAHWGLIMMNEDQLRNNERFVDTLAHFLYQAQATARWRDGGGRALGGATESRSCERCGKGLVPYHCIQSGDDLEGWTCDCEVEST